MSIQIKEHHGNIVARIPWEFRQRVNELKLGRWEPKWECWVFPYSPFVAHTLITTFKEDIEQVSQQVFDLHRSYENAQQAKSAEELPNIPGINLEAWSHQRQGFWFAKHLPGAMLACDMGVGKSLIAAGLIANRDHDKVLIVCPKSVITVWPKELSRIEEELHICPLLKGSIKKRAEQLKMQMKKAEVMGQPFIAIINYESFWREPIAKLIAKQAWDQIIFDEAHRIKAPAGKASKFAAKLFPCSKYRVALTGTPFPHSPLDIFAQYRALDYTIYGNNYHRFKLRYAEMGGFGGKEVVGYKNEQDLAQRFESIAFQAKASEVLDLPEAIHTFRTCVLEPKTWKTYQDLDSQLYTEIMNGEDETGQPVTPANAMVKVLRLQQLTSGYLKTDDGELVKCGTEKRDLLKDILSDFPKDEPVVIFCRFTTDIENVLQVCDELKRTHGELSGNSNDLEDFQNGKVDTLAVQVRSGGVGIDLTRARYCVYYSIGHSLGDYEQSLARTHRPGQTRTVYYYHLLAEDTIDLTVYRALQERKKVIDHILNGARDTIHEAKRVTEQMLQRGTQD